MLIKDFNLERYFAKYEFQTKYLFSSSDCDGLHLKNILDLASEEELELWNKLQLGYTESEGHPKLKESIRQFYTNINDENILVSSPGELNFILMNVLLEKTDHVICISPAYQSLYQIVESIGCELDLWTPSNEDWYYDPADLKKLIKSNTKLIIINFPHNPTGAYPEENQLQEIVDIAKSKNIWLFSDEMYRKLNLFHTPEVPPVCDIYEKGISLWGMAKSFSLAGVRIGWLASQDRSLLEKIVSFKDYLSICSSALSEIISIIALNNAEEILLKNILKIESNVKKLEEFALKYPEFIKFTKPKAGSMAYIKLNIPETAYDFSEQLVKNQGIMTVPAEMFNQNENYLRIGFGRKNFPEVLVKFEKYIFEKYL